MYVRLMAGNVMTGYAFLEVSKGGGKRSRGATPSSW